MIPSFRVGDWRVLPSQGNLQSGAQQVRLEPRVMDLLVHLSEHSDEVLSKERLIQAVWSDAFVADDVLTSAIWKLRRALGDDPRNPSYIKTFSRRGYQLVAEVTFPEDGHSARPGRYRLERKLQGDGKGEVYLAQDTELGRRLVLKFLNSRDESSQARKRRLRREARAVAQLDHPFICKIYDTGKLEGRDFIAMEYIEGQKLSHRLQKGPLPVEEGLRISVEIAEALGAAQCRGIVHCDIQPSAIFLTDQGHVKVTGFGIADRNPARESERDSSLARRERETPDPPIYLSPEQIRGEPLDHRTDLFLFGVVLYEMLTGLHPFHRPTREETKAAILNEDPLPLSIYLEDSTGSLLTETLSTLLAKKPQDRYQWTQHVCNRLRRILGQDDRPETRRRRRGWGPDGGKEIPYPGLTSFTAEQAEYFFGRETEIEVIWEKLKQRHLVGLIGPSGVGKSSLLRAGIVPSLPPGWGVALATPGNRPFLSLAQALVGDSSGDPEAMQRFLHFEEPEVALSLLSEWCSQHREALIIIDQFEELFTLNPRAEQEAFASLLGRMAEEVGVHVLVSMRDDFLFRCHGLDGLESILRGNLIPIGPPVGAALKRALIRPAENCGYRFEDEATVQEMIETVEGERGTLPMLASTAAQLWQLRDRERKLLTREAYEAIGGVVGALAGSAERALDWIGSNRVPIVRELFRNLITARRTRYGQSRERLLSVFGTDQKAEAAQVLDFLLDARLLVSYRFRPVERSEEVEDRIEIIHESLLTHWPRLKRWQTQDAEGAQLRDELRQAAHIWDRHGRSRDLLWVGRAVREYELWQERYPGRLTDLEEEFGKAMTVFARSRSRRKKLALAAVFLLVVVSLIATSTLWRRSEAARLRAEAAHLLALAQAKAESDPTAAVAYATRSLELADTEMGRFFVTDVLTQGPLAFTREIEVDAGPRFSPDGKSLIVTGHRGFTEIWHSDGSAPIRLNNGTGLTQMTSFSVDGRYLWTESVAGDEVEYRIWRFPELKKVNQFTLDRESGRYSTVRHPDGIISLTTSSEKSPPRAEVIPFEGGARKDLGTWSWGKEEVEFYFGAGIAPIVKRVDRTLFLTTGASAESLTPRKLGELPDKLYWHAILSDGQSFATFDYSDRINIWSLDPACTEPPRSFRYPFTGAWNSWSFDDAGHWLVVPTGDDGLAGLWDLTRPVSSGPRTLRRGDRATYWATVHPWGDWVAVGDEKAISLWPLTSNHPSVMHREELAFTGLALDPHGKFATAATGGGRNLRLWSLETTGDDRPKTIFSGANLLEGVAVSFDGSRVAVGSWNGSIFIIAVPDGSVEELTGFRSRIHSIAFDGTASKLAGAAGLSQSEEALIRVWDLKTGEVRILDSGDGTVPERLQFGPGGQLYSSGAGGLRSWSVTEGSSKVLIPNARARLSPDGRFFLVDPLGNDLGRSSDLLIYDLNTGESRSLATDWKNTFDFNWHPSGEAILSMTAEGLIQVGALTGEPPFRLTGHEGFVFAQFHPNGKWIISAGEDGTLRLWPMPDLSKPPIHTLPYDELLVRLKSMTNHRVVEDPNSPNGYRIEYGELPDWEKGLPEW